MEGEAQAKLEYEEFLARYSRRRTETEAEEKLHRELETSLSLLRNELTRTPQPQPIVHEPLQPHPALLSAIQQLQLESHQQLDILRNKQAAREQELKQLRDNNEELKRQVESEKVEHLKVDESNLEKILEKVARESAALQHIQEELKREEERFAQVQTQDQPIVEAKLQKTFDFSALQQELAALEKEEQQIPKPAALNLAQAHQPLLKELAQLKQANQQLRQQQTQLQAKTEQKVDRAAELQAQIKKLHESNDALAKETETLKKVIAEKKEQIKQEETKRKEKAERKNFKQEIIDANKQTEVLEKELERETVKYTDTHKIRRTYVGPENLQLLQRELDRHQQANRPPLAVEQARRDKLVKENANLKARIDYLTKSGQQLEETSQKQLSEARTRGDELVSEKLAQEKLLNQVTSKLNDYMKQFPDHEKRKQQKKNEEKRIKQEQREAERAKAKQEREEKAKAAAAEPTPVDNTNETDWQRWDKWEQAGNLPQREEKSIYNRREFQIASAAIAAIAILILSFGV